MEPHNKLLLRRTSQLQVIMITKVSQYRETKMEIILSTHNGTPIKLKDGIHHIQDLSNHSKKGLQIWDQEHIAYQEDAILENK